MEIYGTQICQTVYPHAGNEFFAVFQQGDPVFCIKFGKKVFREPPFAGFPVALYRNDFGSKSGKFFQKFREQIKMLGIIMVIAAIILIAKEDSRTE